MALALAARRAAPSLSALRQSQPAQSLAGRWFSSGGRVTEVTTNEEYDKLIGSSNLVVVDFTASWCPPCRAIAPVYQQMSEKHTEATFVKVDLDNEAMKKTIGDEEITAVPTFLFYKNKQKLAKIMGADPARLKAAVEKHVG